MGLVARCHKIGLGVRVFREAIDALMEAARSRHEALNRAFTATGRVQLSRRMNVLRRIRGMMPGQALVIFLYLVTAVMVLADWLSRDGD